jgi:SAM-dependent methyltransferase
MHLLTPDQLVRGFPCCPLCASAAAPLFQKYGIWIYGCRTCAHRFAVPTTGPDHVASVYGDDYFFGGGAGYRDYLSEAPLLRAHGQRYAGLLRRFLPPGDLLDVGTAAGFILQGFVDRGWRGVGLEPNPRLSAYARDALGLNVTCGTLEGFRRTQQYDVVCLLQVVAHFVSPAASFAAVAESVRPGGYCLIETWNRDSWTARLLGRHWHEYNPPSVLHWFSPAGLRQALERVGLREVARGRPRKWLAAGHAKSLLRHQCQGCWYGRLLQPGLALFPDRLSLPYPAEDLFWVLFQKSGQGE